MSTDRSSVRFRVEAHLLLRFFFYFPCPRAAGLPVTRGGCKVHTGGSSAVEQRTVKCASAYAVILWSGVQISPPGCFCLHFFFCARRIMLVLGRFRWMRRCVHTIRASIVQG